MNYREFLFVLSCLDWGKVDFYVTSINGSEILMPFKSDDYSIVNIQELQTLINNQRINKDKSLFIVTNIEIKKKPEVNNIIDELIPNTNNEENIEDSDIIEEKDNNLREFVDLLCKQVNSYIENNYPDLNINFSSGNCKKVLTNNYTGLEIPYKEQYVISSFTNSKENNIGVYIGKTLDNRYYYIPIGTYFINNKIEGTKYNSYATFFSSVLACYKDAYRRITNYINIACYNGVYIRN